MYSNGLSLENCQEIIRYFIVTFGVSRSAIYI